MLGTRHTGALAPSAAAAAFAFKEEPIPPNYRLDKRRPIDLVGKNYYADWPAEMQGDRNTCIAFAVAACIELRRAGVGDVDERRFDLAKYARLSPQFLYWYMRQRTPAHPPPGWTEGATKLEQAKEVLEKYGICEWRLCPYEQLSANEPIEGPEPTQDARDQAEANLIKVIQYNDFPTPAQRPSGVAGMVHDQLAQGRPVAVAFPVFYLDAAGTATNWDNPTTASSGEVADPEQDLVAKPGGDLPGHAVCIVGFRPDSSEPTGGWFVFRNSRGTGWALFRDQTADHPRSVPAAGYGVVSATYIERYCWEMLSV
jgi:hypothetical protein